MAPTRQQSASNKKTNGIPRTPSTKPSTKLPKQATLESMEIQRLKEELEKNQQALAAQTQENQHLQWHINAMKRRELEANEREYEMLGQKSRENNLLQARINQLDIMYMEIRETLKERVSWNSKLREEVKQRESRISELDGQVRIWIEKWILLRNEFNAHKEQESQKMEQLEKDLDMMRKTVEAQAVGKWKCCEICLEEYSYEENHVPRFLSCGHTVCHGCTKHLKVSSGVRCPFDRQETRINHAAGEQLPKNFAVMSE